ncbi:MAG: tyrosine-type recombinase/integrase [Leptospiraceae bacterium]|nr:tyrosine-type recombinase/integrase [Leptospiraceae bacterium]NUM42636.1 tyrosine-type recombinase/integrase [Leptospiraceae bacterium]
MLECWKQFSIYIEIEKNYSIHTKAAYLKDLSLFYEFCIQEGVDFLEIEPIDFRSFFAHTLKKQAMDKKTQSRRLSSLRTFYKLLHRNDLIKENPVLSVRFPRTKKNLPKNFSPCETEDLLEHNNLTPNLEKRDKAILEILYSTGIRVFELVGAKLTDLSSDITTLKVLGKRQKERYVFIGEHAKEALQNYLKEREVSNNSEYIFLNQKGKKLTTRGIRYILSTRRKLMGFDKTVTPHKFRHTFATDLLDAGADIRAVQELLGHASLSSTQIYLNVSKDKLREVYRKSHPHAK